MENYNECEGPTSVKETMGVLVQDIFEKAHRLKVRESDLRGKLFGDCEDELQKDSEKRETIEGKLFTIRNLLDITIKRLDEDINNLD